MVDHVSVVVLDHGSAATTRVGSCRARAVIDASRCPTQALHATDVSDTQRSTCNVSKPSSAAEGDSPQAWRHRPRFNEGPS